MPKENDNSARYKPRGKEAQLPHGGLPEVISPHIDQLVREMIAAGEDPTPILIQFYANVDAEHEFYDGVASDPLHEEKHRVSDSAIVKYEEFIDKKGERKAYGRMLWTVTHKCATYCRYCTRGRIVGTGGAISREEADKVLTYLAENPGINEVILSGGDPLTLNPKIFRYIMEKLGELQAASKIKVVRIGTRFPIHSPETIPEAHFDSLKLVEAPRIMLHINHAAELTPETLAVLKRFRHEAHAILYTQSVLLRGVNYFEDEDGNPDPDVLWELFVKLHENHINPYYVFQNDEVYWAKHLTVPIRKGIEMWQQLRSRLSGLAATARYVIDVESGYGKIPVPEGDAWEVNYDAGFKDFKGKRFILDDGRTATALDEVV